MSPLVMFLVLKGGLATAAIGLAVREYVLAGRPDADPELTRRMLRVFSASGRARRPAPLAPSSVPLPAAGPVLEPEAPRRAA